MPTFISRLFAASTPAAPKPATRARLTVEPLEDRAVPAAWTAATVAELVQHINDANAAPGPDTIALAAGARFTLTAVDNTTYGANGLPVVTDELTVVGNGATVERGAAPAFRLFDVAAGASLALHDLTLQGGAATAIGRADVRGGAVHSLGFLSLNGVTIQNNSAYARDYADAQGGGVYSAATLAMANCTIQNNTALASWDGSAYGGGVFASGGLTLHAVTIQGNTARGGDAYRFAGGALGGGLYSNGTLTAEGCTVQNNMTIGGRGADSYVSYNDYSQPNDGKKKYTVPATPGGIAWGGGLFIAGGSATITNSLITANSAQGGEGGAGGGQRGAGVGGGVYVGSDASLILDAFTRDHLKRNKASSGDHDISGTYTVLS